MSEMVAAMEASAVKPAHLFRVKVAIEFDVAWHVYATPDRARYVEV